MCFLTHFREKCKSGLYFTCEEAAAPAAPVHEYFKFCLIKRLCCPPLTSFLGGCFTFCFILYDDGLKSQIYKIHYSQRFKDIRRLGKNFRVNLKCTSNFTDDPVGRYFLSNYLMSQYLFSNEF